MHFQDLTIVIQEQKGEVNWGKFGSLLNPHNNMLNVFGKDKTGIKVAQVSLADLKDRSKVRGQIC